MSDQLDKKSILEMSMGAILERVDDARTVSVFTTYDDVMCRDSLYTAKCDVPGFRDGFREYEQPENEFLLRLDDNGNVGLFEADGGMWEQAAKASITAYFEDKLAQEVKDGKIVVMM